MNYYDEILAKIDSLIDNQDYQEAKRLILNELDISYIPKDVEGKLNELLIFCNRHLDTYKSLDISQIEEYLFHDDIHQLIAIEQFCNLNLRDHYPLIDKYLMSNYNPNACALLIQSMIFQQLDREFVVVKNDGKISFNPYRLDNIEDSKSYKTCFELISERFMKDPSKLQLSLELLYKQLLLALPEILDDNQSIYLANSIIDFVNDAFER